MSYQTDRERMCKTACPFHVADHCITTDCASWYEYEMDEQTRTETEELKSDYPPGFFDRLRGWTSYRTVTREIRVQQESYSGSERTETVIDYYIWMREKQVTIRPAKTGGYCKLLAPRRNDN